MPPRASFHPSSLALSAVVLATSLAAALLGACGGSASATPFPQSPDDITSDPILRKASAIASFLPQSSSTPIRSQPTPQQPGQGQGRRPRF
jgi:hypothetical protein